eukprot:9469093-Pyramimonas_sp.AAC.1
MGLSAEPVVLTSSASGSTSPAPPYAAATTQHRAQSNKTQQRNNVAELLSWAELQRREGRGESRSRGRGNSTLQGLWRGVLQSGKRAAAEQWFEGINWVTYLRASPPARRREA